MQTAAPTYPTLLQHRLAVAAITCWRPVAADLRVETDIAGSPYADSRSSSASPAGPASDQRCRPTYAKSRLDDAVAQPRRSRNIDKVATSSPEPCCGGRLGMCRDGELPWPTMSRWDPRRRHRKPIRRGQPCPAQARTATTLFIARDLRDPYADRLTPVWGHWSGRRARLGQQLAFDPSARLRASPPPALSILSPGSPARRPEGLVKTPTCAGISSPSWPASGRSTTPGSTPSWSGTGPLPGRSGRRAPAPRYHSPKARPRPGSWRRATRPCRTKPTARSAPTSLNRVRKTC